MICCATCKIAYHPQCIEMPERMAALVKTYEWSCVDCRLCSICNKPEKEDEIVFCDRCDRGFHTYCVGLKKLPQGTWICDTYCAIENMKFNRRASAAAVGGGRR
ncbi:PHD-type domain-containing protein [Caenorhabditis elegans]|nr:PHD-type domain-containing protein [Caenorhabditis elegans]CTQ86796.1 PHD-type domain-containing protein [Caenorhabditis elegans]|eukprot:NP_001300097.1 PHd Finger family [Caenorhabditis elegans]